MRDARKLLIPSDSEENWRFYGEVGMGDVRKYPIPKRQKKRKFHKRSVGME